MTKTVHLQDPGPALAMRDIEQFEEEIGGRLPRDYKEFLLASNGGFAEPPVGFYWNGKLNELPAFRKLLSTDEVGLRRTIVNLRELNVEGFLIFTGTLNNEDVCLDVLNKIGAVWLALYTYENDVAVHAKLVPLAKSFTEFMDGLVEMPEPYCRIEELGKHGTKEDLEQYLTEGNSINATEKNEMTLLCEAIKFDNMPLLEACLEHGISLYKALHIAVSNRRPDIVQRLIQAGADINERDEWGDRPLRHVAGICLPGEDGERNRAMQNLLLQLGADRSDAKSP